MSLAEQWREPTMTTHAAVAASRQVAPPPEESLASRRLGAVALWAGLLVRLGAGVLALSTFLPLWLAACAAGGVASLLVAARVLER